MNENEKAREAGKKARENNQNLPPREQTPMSHEQYAWAIKGFKGE